MSIVIGAPGSLCSLDEMQYNAAELSRWNCVLESNQTDINSIYKQIETLSLFDLTQLQSAIHQLLDDPEKTLALKRHLTPGKKVSYFHGRKNAVIDGVLLEVRNTKARIKDLSDDKVWLVPIRAISLDGANVAIPCKRKSAALDRYSLKAGDRVGFEANGQDQFGIIIKLNPKTAVVELSNGVIWRVHYMYLFLVTDGVSIDSSGHLLIEG